VRLSGGCVVFPAADGPDRFIGDAQTGQDFGRDTGQSRIQLTIEDSFRLRGLTLFERFAHADDDVQS